MVTGKKKPLQSPWCDERFVAETVMTIAFHDLDPMQVVWHGNYFKYLEIAREALLKQFNYGYQQMYESGYMWPVVDSDIKYRGSLVFEQRIRVRAVLLEFENRLRIGYEIYDDKSGQKMSTATTTQVAVDMETKELSFVSPQALLNQIGPVKSAWEHKS